MHLCQVVQVPLISYFGYNPELLRPVLQIQNWQARSSLEGVPRPLAHLPAALDEIRLVVRQHVVRQAPLGPCLRLLAQPAEEGADVHLQTVPFPPSLERALSHQCGERALFLLAQPFPRLVLHYDFIVMILVRSKVYAPPR